MTEPSPEPPSRPGVVRRVAVALAVLLVASSCGDDSASELGESTSTTTGSTTTSTSTTTEPAGPSASSPGGDVAAFAAGWRRIPELDGVTLLAEVPGRRSEAELLARSAVSAGQSLGNDWLIRRAEPVDQFGHSTSAG